VKDKPRPLDQVRDRIRRKRYSIRTEQDHVGWIRRFILHDNKRHPRDMGAAEVEAFLTHLAVAKRVSASSGSRSSTSRIRQPGTARSIPIAYRISVLEQREGLTWIAPPPRPLPSGGGISHWTADTSSPPNGRGLRGGPGHTENLNAMGLSPRRAFAEVPRRSKAMGMAVRLSRAHALG
jgi:hypothetical protein